MSTLAALSGSATETTYVATFSKRLYAEHAAASMAEDAPDGVTHHLSVNDDLSWSLFETSPVGAWSL